MYVCTYVRTYVCIYHTSPWFYHCEVIYISKDSLGTVGMWVSLSKLKLKWYCTVNSTELCSSILVAGSKCTFFVAFAELSLNKSLSTCYIILTLSTMTTCIYRSSNYLQIYILRCYLCCDERKSFSKISTSYLKIATPTCKYVVFLEISITCKVLFKYWHTLNRNEGKLLCYFTTNYEREDIKLIYSL